MVTINDEEMLATLYDVKDNGKEVAWKLKRLITLRLAQSYKILNNNKYESIVNCGGYLEFRRYEDSSMRLQTAYFCKTRLCPMCCWRRSRKVFANVKNIFESIEDDYKFLFLTLTIQNVSGNDLDITINKLFISYKNMCLLKRFKSAVKGWVRCFELTYNWQTNEYHPHFHILLAVDINYFNSSLYIEQDEWCSMWKSSLRVDYTPIVDIRVFTESEQGKGKEIAEVTKYTI